jgi:hypothetical protein
MSEDIRKMIDKVKNFKQFVNENADTNNIIAYHGTRYDFDKFDMFYPKGAIGNPKGVYFTRDLQTAIEYAEDVDGGLDDKSRVIKVKLNIDSNDDGVINNHSYSGEEIIMFNLDKIQILNNNVLDKI